MTNFSTIGATSTWDVGNSTGITRLGQKVTAATDRNKLLKNLTAYIKKNGTPIGNMVTTLRKVAGDVLVATSVTVLDVSTLTTSYQTITFNFGPDALIPNEDYRIMLEYAGGSVSNNIHWDGDGTLDSNTGAVITSYSGTYNDFGAAAGDLRGSMSVAANPLPTTNAIDGNTGTRWESNSEVGPYIRLEMSAVADKEILALALITHINTTVTQLKIEVSADGATWIQVRLVNASLLTHGSYNYFRWTRPKEGKMRYLKITGTDETAKVLAVAEVKALTPSESHAVLRGGRKYLSPTDAAMPLAAWEFSIPNVSKKRLDSLT